MPAYVYVGGPCDGRSVTLSTDPPVGSTRTCDGTTYTFNADRTFRAPGTSGGNGGSAGVPFGTKAPTGWHDLQLAVNQRAPTALAKAQRLRRASLGKVRRALR